MMNLKCWSQYRVLMSTGTRPKKVLKGRWSTVPERNGRCTSPSFMKLQCCQVSQRTMLNVISSISREVLMYFYSSLPDCDLKCFGIII